MDYQIGPVSLLGIAMSSIGMFLGCFFILRHQLKNDAYLFLYFAQISIACELFYKTLINSKLIYQFTFLYVPGKYFNLLIYPLFLFFIWNIANRDFKLKKSHWLILIGFLLYSTNWFFKGLMISVEDKQKMLDLFYADQRPGPFNYWANFATLVKSTLLPLAFTIVIGYYFVIFKSTITRLSNRRLLNILSGIIVLYFLFSQFSNLLYRWLFEATHYSMIEWPVDILFLALVLFLFSIIALLVNSGSSFFPASKYGGSALKPNTYEEIVQQAKALIEKESLFLKGTFSLRELANILDTNPKYLSQAINGHLDSNFADFLNSYRVEEAKKKLLDPNNQHLTLEAIGLSAGFSSKSTFFRAFKKHTEFTPNQFIKIQSSANS